MALNLFQVPYELVESLTLDAEKQGYIKNKRLLEINPKGLVPTIEIVDCCQKDGQKLQDGNSGNSKVILESIDVCDWFSKTGNIKEYVPGCSTENHAGDKSQSNVGDKSNAGGDKNSISIPSNFSSPALYACALWANRVVCSPFYRCLVRQDPEEQKQAWHEFQAGWKKFVSLLGAKHSDLLERIEPVVSDDPEKVTAVVDSYLAEVEKDESGNSKEESGKEDAVGYFCSESTPTESTPSSENTPSLPNIVDLAVFPWCFRLYVLKEYRDFELPEKEPWVQKLRKWEKNMIKHEGIQKTLPGKDKLLETYARYAKGTAKSLVGDAVRQGKAAHEI